MFLAPLKYVDSDKIIFIEDPQQFLETVNRVEQSLYREGKQDGIREGKREGIEEGERNKALEIARAMKAKGITPDIISSTTELDEETINSL
jgi:predicted transposase/invertase (TIGR01784 family)